MVEKAPVVPLIAALTATPLMVILTLPVGICAPAAMVPEIVVVAAP